MLKLVDDLWQVYREETKSTTPLYQLLGIEPHVIQITDKHNVPYRCVPPHDKVTLPTAATKPDHATAGIRPPGKQRQSLPAPLGTEPNITKTRVGNISRWTPTEAKPA